MGDTHTPCAAKGAGPGGRGRLSVTGDTEPGGLISYQGNKQRGRPLTAPLIRTITRWAWDKCHRKEGQAGEWMDVRQAQVEPGRDRERGGRGGGEARDEEAFKDGASAFQACCKEMPW